MSCPECGKESRQRRIPRDPGSAWEPEIEAHHECGHCGCCYPIDEMGERMDAAYDSMADTA